MNATDRTTDQAAHRKAAAALRRAVRALKALDRRRAHFPGDSSCRRAGSMAFVVGMMWSLLDSDLVPDGAGKPRTAPSGKAVADNPFYSQPTR